MTNAVRIAELEQRIADYSELIAKAENSDGALTPLGLDVLEARRAQVSQWRAELSRLRNEQPKGGDLVACPACNPYRDDCRYCGGTSEVSEERARDYQAGDAPSLLTPSPAPSPGAQDVLEALRNAANELSYAGTCLEDAEWPNAAAHLRRAEAKALAALAQSDAQPTHRDMAYFGASEAAGYHYPGEDQQLLRDAYCRGAAEYAPKLADAQPVVQSQEGEPQAVAWRWRWSNQGTWFWTDDKNFADHKRKNLCEVEPLYASSPPSPDGAVREALEIACKRIQLVINELTNEEQSLMLKTAIADIDKVLTASRNEQSGDKTDEWEAVGWQDGVKVTAARRALRLLLLEAPESVVHDVRRHVEEAFREIVASSPPSPDGAVRAFAKAVLHGDDEHRAWLLEAAENFISGKSMPAPRGKGTSATQPDGAVRKALGDAIAFIAREYHDPALDAEGEWLPPHARKVHAKLIAAVDKLTAPPQPGLPQFDANEENRKDQRYFAEHLERRPPDPNFGKPPQPGLIEAAELADARALAMEQGSRGGLGSMFADQSAADLREFAKFLRTRAASKGSA